MTTVHADGDRSISSVFRPQFCWEQTSRKRASNNWGWPVEVLATFHTTTLRHASFKFLINNRKSRNQFFSRLKIIGCVNDFNIILRVQTSVKWWIYSLNSNNWVSWLEKKFVQRLEFPHNLTVILSTWAKIIASLILRFCMVKMIRRETIHIETHMKIKVFFHVYHSIKHREFSLKIFWLASNLTADSLLSLDENDFSLTFFKTAYNICFKNV